MKKTLLCSLALLCTIIINSCSEDDSVNKKDLTVKAQPSKIDYYIGENLDLSGLIVSLTKSNGKKVEIPFNDFAERGILISPENGTKLNKESTEVTITYTELALETTMPISFKSVKDIDDNNYLVVKIGNQLWLEENLKTKKFQNGDAIETTNPSTLDITDASDPIYQWAFNGIESNVNTYGRLYTQYVALDNRNVCPNGWHVPSQTEFQELATYLIINGYNYDHTTENNKLGKSIASKSLWNSYPFAEGVPGNNSETNNTTYFNGVASGYRINFSDVFLSQGTTTYWWSSEENSDGQGISFGIQSFQPEASISAVGDINTGAPIRCIKSYE